MLTWAFSWLLSHGIEAQGYIIVYAMVIGGDCLIFFLIACSIRGWPK